MHLLNVYAAMFQSLSKKKVFVTASTKLENHTCGWTACSPPKRRQAVITILTLRQQAVKHAFILSKFLRYECHAAHHLIPKTHTIINSMLSQKYTYNRLSYESLIMLLLHHHFLPVLLPLLSLLPNLTSAACECGYSLPSNTTVPPTFYADLLETDFLHLPNIFTNTDWSPQNYTVTPAAARGPWGKNLPLSATSSPIP